MQPSIQSGNQSPDAPSQLSKVGIPNYVQVGAWLLRNAFGQAPVGLTILVLIGFAGAALQASVLLTLYWATGQLSESGSIQIPVLGITLAKSTAFYAITAVIVLQAATAATCVYIYRVRTIYFWGRYQLFLGQRLLAEIARAVREDRIDEARLAENPVVLHVLSRNVQRIGMLFRRLIAAVASVVRMLVFLALSLYVHAGVTLILLAGAAIVGAISVLKFARDTSRKSRALRGDQRLARQQWRTFTARAAAGETVVIDNKSIRGQPIGDFLTTFQARYINKERSRVVGMIAMVVLAALTMAVYGNAVLDGRAAWQDMTTAIVAVILTMLPMSDLASVASFFGHYYPDLKMYRDVLDGVRESRDDAQFTKRLAAISAGTFGTEGPDDTDDDM